jgi:hypothetical protein
MTRPQHFDILQRSFEGRAVPLWLTLGLWAAIIVLPALILFLTGTR